MSSNVKFDNALQKTKFLLKLSGAGLDKPRNTISLKHKNNTIFFINMFILVFDLYGEIREMFLGTRLFSQLSFAFTCAAYSTLCVTKIIFVRKNHDAIIYILKKICIELPNIDKDKFEENTLEGNLHKEMYRAMLIYNVIVKVIFYTNLILLIVVMATPIFVIIYFYFVNDEVKVLYPLVASYDYINLTDPLFWPILYPHQCWSGIFTLAGIIGSDFLFFTFCTYILLQFKIIGYQISTVVAKCRIDKYTIDNNILNVGLGRIIKRHQELIRLVTIINDIYSKALFVHYSLSSIIICICGFNIAITHDMAFFVSFTIALMSSQWQIFIICYFGDNIVTSSSEFAQDIYSSDWTSCDKKIRKTILIMIMRSQKQCKITAYKFSDVNLKTFTGIMSTSWSYFALLKTMYSSK